MDSLSATSLFSALNFIIIFVSSVSTDQTNITAEPGHDASLPCRSPDNKPVLVLEWIRPDLGSEYVLLYRNDQLELENQHVMFRNRVDLLNRQMKDGNVSLALRKVTPDDRGEYECRFVQTNSWIETVFIINLEVLPPPVTNVLNQSEEDVLLSASWYRTCWTCYGDAGGGNRDGSVDLIGLVVGVVVSLLVMVLLALVAYLRRKKASCCCPKPNQPPVDPAGAQQLLTDQNQPAEQNPV